MEVEKALLKDLPEILALQKLAYLSEAELYSDFNIQPLVQTLDNMILEFEEMLFLKATVNHSIVGSVRGKIHKKNTCYIGRLMVHPSFQNQGIGKSLMEEIEKRFDQCDRYELYTGSRSVKNLHLYEKIGYRIFDTIPAGEKLKLAYMEKENRKGDKNG